MSNNFGKCLVLYKPNSAGNGAASQFSIGSKKDCVFLEMANQNGKDDKGNANFVWDKKIVFKLGIVDIGELLAVLVGFKKGVGPLDDSKKRHKGLYHSNNKGNTILYFGKDDQNKLRIYLSSKSGSDQTIIKHSISDGEACVLSTLLRHAIEIIHHWDAMKN